MPRSVLAAAGCRHRPWNAVSLEDHMAPYTRYGEQPRRSRRDRPIVVRAPSPGSHGCGGGFRTPSKSQCDRSGSQAVDSSVKLCWICYPEPCLRPMSVPCGRENAGCVLHCQWDWCSWGVACTIGRPGRDGRRCHDGAWSDCQGLSPRSRQKMYTHSA